MFEFQDRILQSADRDKLCLFLQMRLGKTRVAHRWGNWVKGPRLVVCPLSVFSAWVREIPSVTLLRKVVPLPLRSRWYLTNYEFVRHNPDVAALPWTTVVLDESTKIKNPKSALCRSCNLFKCRRRAILSGLPNPESYLDLWAQMRWVYSSWMGCHTYWQFVKRYFVRVGYDWVPKKGTTNLIRQSLEELTYVVSRKEVGINLKKMYEVLRVTLPPEVMKVYREAETYWATEGLTTKYAVTAYGWLSRITSGYLKGGERPNLHTHKISAVLNHMTGRWGLLKRNVTPHQLVVFSYYLSDLIRLQYALRDLGVSCELLTGAVSPEERISCLTRFRSGQFRVILLQVKVGKYGLDLSNASAAYFITNSLSLEDRRQAEDRVVHPQKAVTSFIIDVVAEGTVDEAARDSLLSKHVAARQLLDNFAGKWRRQWQERK